MEPVVAGLGDLPANGVEAWQAGAGEPGFTARHLRVRKLEVPANKASRNKKARQATKFDREPPGCHRGDDVQPVKELTVDCVDDTTSPKTAVILLSCSFGVWAMVLHVRKLLSGL